MTTKHAHAAVAASDDADLDRHLEEALLAGDNERAARLEQLIAAREVEARREAARQRGLERQERERAEAERQDRAAAERAARDEARDKLAVVERELSEASRQWARLALAACELGVAADNTSRHGVCCESLRSALHRLPPPWGRRLLMNLGSWPSPATRGFRPGPVAGPGGEVPS